MRDKGYLETYSTYVPQTPLKLLLNHTQITHISLSVPTGTTAPSNPSELEAPASEMSDGQREDLLRELEDNEDNDLHPTIPDNRTVGEGREGPIMGIVTRINSPDGTHENNVPVDFHEVITRFRDKEVVKEI